MARILLVLSSAVLCCADPLTLGAIKLGRSLKMHEKVAMNKKMTDAAGASSSLREEGKPKKLMVQEQEQELEEEQGWTPFNLENCGEPVAFWGSGDDRTKCPCKSDPSKKPIIDTIEKRLELLEKSPEHRWKLNASEVVWKGQYYINLEKSEKRKWFIEEQLRTISKVQLHKMQTRRWSGTDPYQAQKADLKEFTDEGLGDYVQEMAGRVKWGTIGTYLSHLRLLRAIWRMDKEGEGLYVIMEDDGTLDKNWQAKVEKAIKDGNIPKDWDMIKFGYWGLVRCEDKVRDDPNAAYEARVPMMLNDGTRKSYYNGNLGYIVRPKSVPAILKAIRKMPLYDVDGVFVGLNNENATAEDYGIRSYYMKHSLVKGGTGGEGLATERIGGTNSQYALEQKLRAGRV